MESTLTPDTLVQPESTDVDKQAQGVTESAQADKQPGQVIDEGVGAEQQTIEPKPYSYEELEKETDFTKLDPKRLPGWYAKQVNAYKSLQGEYTKTKERLGSLEKQAPGQEPPPRDAFEAVERAFNKNDYTTIQSIFGHLKGTIHQKKMDLFNAKQADPLDPKIGALEQEIYQYESLGDQLQGKISGLNQQKEVINSLVSSTESDLFKAIPDFKERAPELMKFATEDLGLAPDMIYAITDPVAWTAVYLQGGRNPTDAFRLGKETVVKVQDAINKMQLRISGKGLQQKLDKTPPKVEGTGSNYSGEKGTSAKTLFDKAVKTGLTEDWARYQDVLREENQKSRRK